MLVSVTDDSDDWDPDKPPLPGTRLLEVLDSERCYQLHWLLEVSDLKALQHQLFAAGRAARLELGHPADNPAEGLPRLILT